MTISHRMRAISMFQRSLLILALASAACGGARTPRDVDNGNPRSEFSAGAGSPAQQSAGAPPRVIAVPTAAGHKPRTFATVETRAIAIGGELVFFGDIEDDALVLLPKNETGSTMLHIARRAPMAGALSLDLRAGTVAWIPNPGDTVLRIPIGGGTATTIRDRGIFTNVAADGGDVFVTEVQGEGGALTRITGTTTAKLAAFDGTPRGLTVDATHAYIATSSRLVAAPRARGELVELARGIGFGSPQVDDAWIYATAAADGTRERVIVRAKKTGGDAETIASGVRDAPLVLHGSTLYWFDASKAALLSMPVDAAPAPNRTRVVSEDPAFERASALAIDDDDAYVATGAGESARIVRVRLGL